MTAILSRRKGAPAKMCERSFAYVRIKTRVQPLCIRVSLSKNLVEFRRRSGEKKSNHFLR